MKLSRFKSPQQALCTCLPKYNLNPYLGRCEHACIYCYSVKFPSFRGKTRPRLNLIDDIESMARNTKPKLPIMISDATDPYQPLEKQYEITRYCLKVLIKYGYPLLILTKSDLITRDIDILKSARCIVGITITTLDEEQAKMIEPNAPSPIKRLAALEKLTEAGLRTFARIDPVIPTFNDREEMLEKLINEIAIAGAKQITVSTLKPVRGFFTSLARIDLELSKRLRSIYDQGECILGYRYLPIEIRRSIILRLYRIASKFNLAFASCREGLSHLNTTLCDGSSELRFIEKYI
ncbi:MAG: radical SAM protein [Methanocellales archaeon]